MQGEFTLLTCPLPHLLSLYQKPRLHCFTPLGEWLPCLKFEYSAWFIFSPTCGWHFSRLCSRTCLELPGHDKFVLPHLSTSWQYSSHSGHHPFWLYEWTAMSQGLKNTPSIHQHWMNTALCPLIGKICHIYITNIVIWLNTVAEHVKHINMVMKSLITTCLFCNPKKCDFFLTKMDFLGHCISTWGIEPNTSKFQKILDWPIPTNLTEVWGFLGLVWYIASFLPKLADHTYPLIPLTNKSMKLIFSWTADHQFAFESIKALIVRAYCLTVIDYTNAEKNNFLSAVNEYCIHAWWGQLCGRCSLMYSWKHLPWWKQK